MHIYIRLIYKAYLQLLLHNKKLLRKYAMKSKTRHFSLYTHQPLYYVHLFNYP